MATKTKTIPIKDLDVNLFVRKELNPDHVLYLADLIHNGVKMRTLIKVTEKNEVIDGRHRVEAYELCNTKSVKCEIVKVASKAEIISEAYRSNVGGSLPPTPQDTEHTIMLLLEQNETIKRIGELLGLPPAMARKYVRSVKSRMSRAKLQHAATAVTDGGLTVAKAAEQHNVDPDKLREILSGRRRKQKWGIPEIKRNLTNAYKTVGMKNSRILRKMFEKYEDGDVSEKQVKAVIAHIEHLQKQSARTFAERKKRFTALKKGK